MIVYRLSLTAFARDLTGEGARLHGGRWNHPGTPCLYTSESRALAVLEYTVNVNIAGIPTNLSMVAIEIPADEILHVDQAILPPNWRTAPAPASTKDFANSLLAVAKKPVIKIPSVIIPEEFNYLLNPLHTGSQTFRIRNTENFVYDIRIKSM